MAARTHKEIEEHVEEIKKNKGKRGPGLVSQLADADNFDEYLPPNQTLPDLSSIDVQKLVKTAREEIEKQAEDVLLFNPMPGSDITTKKRSDYQSKKSRGALSPERFDPFSGTF
ncbi:hypothetical protein MXB_585 [Myxobolus squamalis]|nr:hypothetical protein MXB_585 [Myxobolus squamalis]